MTKEKFERIFPPPPAGKMLGFNVQSAKIGTAEMFRLRPYQERHPGHQKYGIIQRDVPGETNQYTGQPLVKRANVLVEILDPQIDEEASEIYSSIHFVFFKREDDWGVEFAADDIIAAQYLRLTDSDMERLLAEGGITL